MKPFKLINNTDGVDIRDKALGLDVQYESLSPLHSNRGLHIQIKHNGDKATFNEAVRIAQLLTAASELLEALEQLRAVAILVPDNVWAKASDQYNESHNEEYRFTCDISRDAINKARGKQ